MKQYVYQVINLLDDKVLFESFIYADALKWMHENHSEDSPVLDIKAIQLDL